MDKKETRTDLLINSWLPKWAYIGTISVKRFLPGGTL